MKTTVKEPAKTTGRRKLKWEATKGHGVLPTHFGKAKHLDAQAPSSRAFPGGRDLVIETFGNAGDPLAPESSFYCSPPWRNPSWPLIQNAADFPEQFVGADGLGNKLDPFSEDARFVDVISGVAAD
jgi:hypothetical protein